MCLLIAMEWVVHQGFKNVVFETDAKTIVDAVHSNEDFTEFGSLIKQCKQLMTSDNVFSVCFVRRQANKIAHALTRSLCSFASPSVWMVPPLFIEALLVDDYVDDI
ncbi:hypothetical protein PTKIN_Ptkin12aG0067800 [Pterospermum kingtungense]